MRRPTPRQLRRAGGVLLLVWLTVGAYNVVRPLPAGTSVEGPYRTAANVEFLRDLTYVHEGDTVVEQEIFDRVLRMIDEAERFVVIDMFLFNEEHGGDRSYPRLSGDLTERLVAKRTARPQVPIVFTTDEINTFYGAYEPAHLEALREAGVEVILTDLTELRDSNPAYSGLWRAFLQWFGSAGPALLPHPLTSRGRRVTGRSYLRLFNMKANHRKLIVTDRGCLVASANPHDASGFHSNVAWVASGPVCDDVLESERGIAAFSGAPQPLRRVDPETSPYQPGSADPAPGVADQADAATGQGGQAGGTGARVRFLSEGRIGARLEEAIDAATPSAEIDVAMFYLSDRGVVRALSRAADRGARVRLVLDPNKDAFGREKGGIPNRQVALELDALAGATVRWYDTRGEQFHTKLVVVRDQRETVMLGGSANLTRRNLRDYNLEADLEVMVPRGHPLDVEVADYFERLWSNREGDFTLPFEAYRDTSLLKRLVYRVQEATGLSSF